MAAPENYQPGDPFQDLGTELYTVGVDFADSIDETEIKSKPTDDFMAVMPQADDLDQNGLYVARLQDRKFFLFYIVFYLLKFFLSRSLTDNYNLLSFLYAYIQFFIVC